MKWDEKQKPASGERQRPYRGGDERQNRPQAEPLRRSPAGARDRRVENKPDSNPQPLRFWERIVETPSAIYTLQRSWRVVRIFAISLSAFLLVVAGALLILQYANTKYFKPVNGEDHTPVLVTITRGTSISSIAEDLEEMELVRSASVYKLYVDLSGNAGKMKAGSYWLDKSMTYQQITEKIVRGNGGQQVQTFLLREGLTVEQMAQSLVQQGVLTSPDRFLELCRSGEAFAAKYDFINKLLQEDHSDRKYQLEGYLFPAKYEIYVGSSEETIIEKMLDKTKTVMNADFMERAEEQKMSVDDVITLASLIEREATTKDFYKVSAVFYNRQTKNMRLELDSTVNYATGKNLLVLDPGDTSIESPYNTYKNNGLPAGPISNPGLEAIKAALYPDETYIAEMYLFFQTKDPASGELAFNKTLEAHNKDKEKYKPLWDAYQQSHSATQGTNTSTP